MALLLQAHAASPRACAALPAAPWLAWQQGL